jgi:predicted nucleotidyltransferase component of viral defense system
MTGPVLAEWEQVASSLGVGMEQVRRDHSISHVLAAISSNVPSDHLVFFGGTALSRTHVADARLSRSWASDPPTCQCTGGDDGGA